MGNALNVFESIVLPLFDKSLDLESTLYYFDNISVPSFSRALYLKLDNPKAFFEKIKKRKIKELEYSIQNGLHQKVSEKYDEYIEKIEKRINDYLSFIDEKRKDENQYNIKIERLNNNMECNLEIIKQLTEDNYSYCKFSIAVDHPKRNDTEAVETDIFTCLAFNDNAKSVGFLYSKGGQITFVGSLRKAPDNTAVIIVEELHFQNRFAVKVDVDSGQLF